MSTSDVQRPDVQLKRRYDLIPNLVEVAASSVAALTLPGEIGNMAADLLQSLLEQPDAAGSLACNEDQGRLDYQLSDNPFAPGSTLAVTFHDCAQGTAADLVRLDGRFELTATGLSGDLLAAPYALQARLELDSVVTTDAVGSSVIDGGLRFSRSADAAGARADLAESVDADPLRLSESGVARTLGAFAIGATRSAAGITLGTGGEVLDLRHDGLGLDLRIRLLTPFSGAGLASVEAGRLAVEAPLDGSRLDLSVTDAAGSVELALDSDADGSAEDLVRTTWDELH